MQLTIMIHLGAIITLQVIFSALSRYFRARVVRHCRVYYAAFAHFYRRNNRRL